MSFTRKRVPLACTFCRSRKRRCDALRPSCSHCQELQVDCHYDDTPSQRIDSTGGVREIMRNLDEIKSMLQTLSTPNGNFSQSPIETTSIPHDVLVRGQEPHESPTSAWLPEARARPTSPESSPLIIPVKHKTSSSYLLGLPPVKALIGEYPPDLFFRLESKSQLPPELDFDNGPISLPPFEIPEQVASNLISVFFTVVHPNHPILNSEIFHEIYSKFLETGPDSSIESALCMVVLALGAVASSQLDPNIFNSSPPGLIYIQHAMQTLLRQSSWSFSFDLMLPQGLVLASIYFAYIIRPLQSWRLIHSATVMLQLKLSGIDSRDEEPGLRESVTRLFWSCFVIECDRLAELELPRSELQQLTDEISLPNCTNLDMMQATCYLAEISIRRLLNRTHGSLYPRKKHGSSLSSTSFMITEDFSIQDVSAMNAVCDELHSQLNSWYSSIPEAYQPNLDVTQNINDRQAILRTRYFATRHIIYRPFVLYIVTHGREHTSETMVAKAGICIESCRSYIHSTRQLLEKPSQYTWTFALSSLGAIVVLTLSSLNPLLRELVLDIDELQSIVLDNIRPWAFSSLEAVVTILEDMQKKRRLLSRV